MIHWHGKDPVALYWNGKVIAWIYRDSNEVWTSALSCYGKGYWVDTLPWTDTDAWVD